MIEKWYWLFLVSYAPNAKLLSIGTNLYKLVSRLPMSLPSIKKTMLTIGMFYWYQNFLVEMIYLLSIGI